VKPDWGKAQLEEKGLQREKCVVGTWLGHAGVLVEMGIRGSGGGGGSAGGKGKRACSCCSTQSFPREQGRRSGLDRAG
jgi:hypothetical protein